MENVAAIPLAWSVRMEHPWWLLLVVAAAGPVVLAAWARRRGRGVPASNVALQCLAILVAAAALARPTAPVGPRARTPVLVLRDVSASCRGQLDRTILLPDDLPAERFDFAAAVAPEAEPVDANQTRLAPALRFAVARREQLAGVVLATDGRFTDDDWQVAAASLGRTGLPVWLLPMASPPADARVAELTARRQPGGEVHVQLVVSANALLRRKVELRRTHPPAAEPLVVQLLDLLAGQAASFRATDDPPGGGLAAYRAELSPADVFGENDTAEAVVLPDRQRIALLGSGVEPAALAAALKLPTERPSAPPQTAAGWMDYAAVVLVDANGTLLPARSRAALGRYVRTGGALVLVGAGPHASAADRDDPLNRAAALIANPYERRPLRLVVVLDASGSMALTSSAPGGPGRRIKFGQAIEAVLSLRRHLTEADRLSVLTFADAPRRVYDSRDAPVNFAALAEALGRVRPGGPTIIGPALEQATDRGAGEGRDGLVVVVSDLRTKEFRPDRMAERFGRQKLSLAVVAIAPAGATQPASRTPLERLAGRLKAPVVRRDHLGGLAKVFAGFVREARGEPVRRGDFRAAAGPIFSRPAGPLPDVQAYLPCAPQPNAETLARVGEQGDPLLAIRRVGLGRSAALALPLAPGDNPAWRSGGKLLAVLAELVRGCRRPTGDPRFAGHARRQDTRLHVVIEAADGSRPMNGLQLTGRISSPRPGAQADHGFTMRQTAPGRYEARVPASAGPVGLAVSRDGAQVVWQAAVARAAPRELADVGADWRRIRLLADLTGGRVAADGDLAELGERLAPGRRTAFWPILLAAAVALALTEWAVARIWHRSR